jgi:hypothetical protein
MDNAKVLYRRVFGQGIVSCVPQWLEQIRDIRSGVLLDNTTLYTALQLLSDTSASKDGSPHTRPHYWLDLAIVATAVAFFDRVFFIQIGKEPLRHQNFFDSFVTDKGDPVFVALRLDNPEADDDANFFLSSIYHSVTNFLSLPSVIEGYQKGWEQVLDRRPKKPDFETLEYMLRTPKHVLQSFADEIIARGYQHYDLRQFDKMTVVNNMIEAQTCEYPEYLDQYSRFCELSSTKGLFYAQLGQKLGLCYLPNSLRGAGQMMYPISNNPFVQGNRDKYSEELQFLFKLQSETAKYPGDSIEIKKLTRVPLLLTPLLQKKLSFPNSTFLDCLMDLRREYKPWRETINRYHAQVTRGETANIKEAVAALDAIHGDFEKLDASLKEAGILLSAISELDDVTGCGKVITMPFKIIAKGLTGEAARDIFIQRHIPYLHIALSLKNSAIEAYNFTAIYNKIYGSDYSERFNLFFQRLLSHQPVLGFSDPTEVATSW